MLSLKTMEASDSALFENNVRRAIVLSLKTMDSAFIEYNEFASEWGCNPFWSNYIVCNQTSMASVIAALTLMLSVNEP